jgi:hypothetical protein
MKRLLLILVGVCGISSVAFAQSVKEKKAWDKITEQSKKAAETIKGKCGVEVSIMPDKKSWNSIELAEGPALWCISEGESVIVYLCDDADYKAAVAKSLKKVNCVNDPKLPNSGSADKYGNKLSLKGGVVEWRYHKDSANLGEYLREFLKEAL